jgi:formylglycine-generating enzyme required for sulfatase activity
MLRLFALFTAAAVVSPSLGQPGEPKPGEVRKFEIAKDVFMEFCWIPSDECQLGSPNKEPGFMDDELELYRGKFKTNGFWLGKYTVTQGEWQAVMGNNPSEFDGIKDNKAKGMNTKRFPVENVSLNDCQQFLEKINKREGIVKVFGKDGKFVLPHEDQWEYAYYGGKGNKQPFYWGDKLNGTETNSDGELALGTTMKGQFLGRTCSVDFTNNGKYEKHPWGLFHMSGNVYQWCECSVSPK